MIGQQHGCLPYVIAIVSALSVGDLFLPQQQLGFNADEDLNMPSFESGIASDIRVKLHSSYYRAHLNNASMDPESDAIKLLSVVCAFEYEKNPADFCSRCFVRLKAMEETRKLRQQISKIVMDNCPGVLSAFQAKLPLPSKLQVIDTLLYLWATAKIAIDQSIETDCCGWLYRQYCYTRRFVSQLRLQAQ
jgi:ATP-dependent RNA helicase DHX37/DHR1